MTSSYVNNAASVLINNGIIAHQTDTVIGLACLPKEILLTRLSQLKLRSESKSFILLASSLHQLTNFINITDSDKNSLTTPTSQPTTWIVTASEQVPNKLKGANNTIAIRISQHINVKSICDHVGAIVSTSANITNQKTCNDIYQVRSVFGPNIDYIDPNQSSGTAKSSTIIELQTGTVLRA